MNKKNQIRICDFTKAELECFVENCNFTKDEREAFDLRAEYYTLEQVAEKMNISAKTAYRINKRIKDKIRRVCVQIHKESLIDKYKEDK